MPDIVMGNFSKAANLKIDDILWVGLQYLLCKVNKKYLKLELNNLRSGMLRKKKLPQNCAWCYEK